nr:reverse transcriptase domain-containing protein [Tanacetum cinerariifolium]
MEIKDKLDLDQNRTPVDATKYRSMIGALMYLTSSRPDIVHATCLCARYQAKPTEKHLKEVKRIFCYLRGAVNMSLWYTKDSVFELTGFSDVDYAGCKDTFKSTSGGAQFLGEKLVSWSSKKQDSRAGWIYSGTLPLDRVEVLVMNGNPSRVNIKQLCGRISRWRYNLTSAESKFKTPHARSSRQIHDESSSYHTHTSITITISIITTIIPTSIDTISTLSPTCMDIILKAGMPLWKRVRFTTPSYRFETEESSAPATARQTGPALTHGVDYGFIDTVDASIRATDRRMVTALEGKLAPKKTHMNDVAIKALMAQGVADALADYEAKRGSGNAHDSHGSRSGRGRTSNTARVCTYKDFLNCQPLNNKGTKGVVGSMMASKPKTMQEEIEIDNDLMDQKVRTFTERQAENKRNLDDNTRNSHTQQQPFTRQNVAKAYTAGPSEKKEYEGSLPPCTKCNYHHTGSCAAKCTNCKRVGHLALDCRSLTATANNQRAPKVIQKVVTCYECGVQGNKDFLKLKNKDHGNQVGNIEVRGKANVLGGDETNTDSNVVTGTFLLNNRYTSILFDTGTDRSFVSTALSSLIDIIPTTFDNSYDVELADGRITGVNTIIRGCMLNLLNHTFNINIMPVELGSFEVIIDMDWLSLYHVVIVCDKKTVRVPFGNETLIIHGDRSNHGNESRLNIISCTKTSKYLLKGCHVFLAQITKKKAEDKSDEK